MRSLPLCLFAVVAVAVGALLAAACEPGAGVTFVNNTDKVLFVSTNGEGMRIQPHSKLEVAEVRLEDDPYMITVRDEAGNIIYYEETTLEDLKERDYWVVIEEPTPGAQ